MARREAFFTGWRGRRLTAVLLLASVLPVRAADDISFTCTVSRTGSSSGPFPFIAAFDSIGDLYSVSSNKLYSINVTLASQPRLAALSTWIFAALSSSIAFAHGFGRGHVSRWQESAAIDDAS